VSAKKATVIYIDHRKLNGFIRGLQNAKMGLKALERVEIAVGNSMTMDIRQKLFDNVKLHHQGLTDMLKPESKEFAYDDGYTGDDW
jgi:hypothetical protein